MPAFDGGKRGLLPVAILASPPWKLWPVHTTRTYGP